MTRKDRSPAQRLYQRNGRWWLDVRDLGGKLEPLVVPGDRFATTDRSAAEQLAHTRVALLQSMPRQAGQGVPRTLEAYASHYLVAKARAGKVGAGHLADLETRLTAATTHFGADRPLERIRPRDVRAWLETLATKDGTRRAYLNALSNLYRYAIADEVVPVGYNPAAALVDKPRGRPAQQRWLEVHEGALLLEAARRLPPLKSQVKAPDAALIYPFVAVLLLTGCRPGEALDLATEDVSFDHGTVTFRPHAWTRGGGHLKTAGASRVVPLWPQLRSILLPILNDFTKPPTTLLFPSPRTGKPITSLRHTLRRLLKTLGWTEAQLEKWYGLRHTYTAARLQTLDHGAPVAPYTVARELGHKGLAMVERVYGHLGQQPHRSEVVEFRLDQHLEKLGDTLDALGWAVPVTTPVTGNS